MFSDGGHRITITASCGPFADWQVLVIIKQTAVVRGSYFRRAADRRSGCPEGHRFAEAVFYYDVYRPPPSDFSPVTMKAMGFAYQRDGRIVLDPWLEEPIADGAFAVAIACVEDVDAVYAPNGRWVAGTRLDTFLTLISGQFAGRK